MSNNTKNLTEKVCRTCMFHDEFSWACCNGYSPYVAEFMDDRSNCGYWKEKEEKENNFCEKK